VQRDTNVRNRSNADSSLASGMGGKLTLGMLSDFLISRAACRSQFRIQVSLQSGIKVRRIDDNRPCRSHSLHIKVDCNPVIGCPISRLNLFLVDFDGIAPGRQLADIAVQSERTLEVDNGFSGAHVPPNLAAIECPALPQAE